MTTRKRQLRNIGIIAHVDAGKTTTSERILFYTGENHRVGEVHDGNTALDFDPLERQHGITISSAATTVFWQGVQLNLIDTPGHIDFNIEVNRSLRVLDGAVVVFDGVAGVEPQTETNWRLADKYRVPRLAFINKLDRSGADALRVVDMLRERLGVQAVLLQLPLGSEQDFHGVIDLLSMQTLSWSGVAGEAPKTGEIPAVLRAEAEQYRARLLEQVVEQDEAALALWLEGQELTPEQLRSCIRRGTLNGAFVPVLLGAAFRNRGIEPLLDAVVHYLPAPGEIEAVDGIESDPEAPLAALAFKVVNDEHGTLTFVRLYRGRLRAGDSVLNASTGKRERVSRIYEMHADRKREREQIEAGDIAAVVGLKATVTGHTLSDPAAPLLLESISVPEPVLDIAIEARSQTEQPALFKGLQALLQEDPSLRLRQDADSGQTLLSGMGELQLDITLEKLRQRFQVEAVTGRPQVAFRETITQATEVRHLHRKQNGGIGQYAEVVLQLEPQPAGSGWSFEHRVVGGAVPREYIPAVEAGARRASQSGVVGGFAVVDMKVILIDGSHHEKDSSSLAFELAAAAALREGLMQAGSVLLEPVMAVEVFTPADHIGPVIGDLNRRRGEVQKQEPRGTAVVITAQVPLRDMFGYIGQLRALTSGRASFTMHFDHYRAVPAALASGWLKAG